MTATLTAESVFRCLKTAPMVYLKYNVIDNCVNYNIIINEDVLHSETKLD